MTTQFQIKKLEEIVTQRQVMLRAKVTQDEAIELAQTLYAHGIYSSVVSSDYRARLHVTNALFHWLASMANLSDGICRLICEQVRPLVCFCDDEDVHHALTHSLIATTPVHRTQ